MARDLFHDAVKRALQKEGWHITHDPLILNDGDTEFEVDLGAERLMTAERGNEQIAVEVKSFLGRSQVHEFHAVLGQYLSYRLMLELTEQPYQLYLAVPEVVYQTLLGRSFYQRVIEHHKLNLLIYNEEQEVIVLWR